MAEVEKIEEGRPKKKRETKAASKEEAKDKAELITPQKIAKQENESVGKLGSLQVVTNKHGESPTKEAIMVRAFSAKKGTAVKEPQPAANKDAEITEEQKAELKKEKKKQFLE